MEDMSSQFVMTSRVNVPKSALPLAFTEHGVVMLLSILRSDIAIQTSVLICVHLLPYGNELPNSCR